MHPNVWASLFSKRRTDCLPPQVAVSPEITKHYPNPHQCTDCVLHIQQVLYLRKSRYKEKSLLLEASLFAQRRGDIPEGCSEHVQLWFCSLLPYTMLLPLPMSTMTSITKSEKRTAEGDEGEEEVSPKVPWKGRSNMGWGYSRPQNEGRKKVGSSATRSLNAKRKLMIVLCHFILGPPQLPLLLPTLALQSPGWQAEGGRTSLCLVSVTYSWEFFDRASV